MTAIAEIVAIACLVKGNAGMTQSFEGMAAMGTSDRLRIDFAIAIWTGNHGSRKKSA
jgi:hypothetical protein